MACPIETVSTLPFVGFSRINSDSGSILIKLPLLPLFVIISLTNVSLCNGFQLSVEVLLIRIMFGWGGGGNTNCCWENGSLRLNLFSTCNINSTLQKWYRNEKRLDFIVGSKVSLSSEYINVYIFRHFIQRLIQHRNFDFSCFRKLFKVLIIIFDSSV